MKAKTENKNSLKVFAYFVIISYFILIFSIKILGPSKLVYPDEFPTSCPENSIKCVMIGPIPHRGDELTELRFESSLEQVMAEVNHWINSEPRTNIIGEWENHTHSVFTTKYLRFEDDFIVNGHCDGDSTILYVYSSSRLGISDLGLNEKRVDKFVNYFSNLELPKDNCNNN